MGHHLLENVDCPAHLFSPGNFFRCVYYKTSSPLELKSVNIINVRWSKLVPFSWQVVVLKLSEWILLPVMLPVSAYLESIMFCRTKTGKTGQDELC